MNTLLICLIFSNLITLSALWILVRKIYKMEKNISSSFNEIELNLKRTIKEYSLRKDLYNNTNRVKKQRTIVNQVKKLSALVPKLTQRKF